MLVDLAQIFYAFLVYEIFIPTGLQQANSHPGLLKTRSPAGSRYQNMMGKTHYMPFHKMTRLSQRLHQHLERIFPPSISGTSLLLRVIYGICRLCPILQLTPDSLLLTWILQSKIQIQVIGQRYLQLLLKNQLFGAKCHGRFCQ